MLATIAINSGDNQRRFRKIKKLEESRGAGLSDPDLMEEREKGGTWMMMK